MCLVGLRDRWDLAMCWIMLRGAGDLDGTFVGDEIATTSVIDVSTNDQVLSSVHLIMFLCIQSLLKYKM